MNALQSIKAAIFIVLIFVFSSINLADIFSQDTTKNNYTGDWEADASWVDGTSPGTTVNGVDL